MEIFCLNSIVRKDKKMISNEQHLQINYFILFREILYLEILYLETKILYFKDQPSAVSQIPNGNVNISTPFEEIESDEQQQLQQQQQQVISTQELEPPSEEKPLYM